MFIHMCNYSDEVTKERSDEVTNEVTKCGSDSPTVNERLMLMRLDNTCSCTVVLSVRHITVSVQACDTSRGRRTRNERSRTKA